MIYNIDVFGDIGNSIGVALRSFVGWVISQIFNLIVYLFEVFDIISKTEILENEFIKNIYRKVGLILGLFMLFKLVFSLVNSLIAPEKFDDKKNGVMSIVKRCVVSIVLLGITPTLFEEAFEIQQLLVGDTPSKNVLYKLISNNPDNLNVKMGHALASDLYLSFFTDREDPKLEKGVIDKIYPNDDIYYDRFINNDYKTLETNLKEGHITFDDTIEYLTIKGAGTSEYVIEFNWLVLLIVGIIVVWMLVMYCVQVSIRVVQLAYLQLIAPIPILSYISDPDGTFQKWVKQCVSTYLDLFFRLAIIYFVMIVIDDVLTQFKNMSGVIIESSGINQQEWFTLGLVKFLIILGLLLFAKKAPELIKDLFPNLGGGVGKFSFGLNPKKEVIEPLKDIYNKTPLGWTPKVAGKLAKGAIGFVDRKVHNLPKPRNKVQQYIDKIAPGYAETVKNKRQAVADEHARKRYIEEGKDLYRKYSIPKPDGSGELTLDYKKVFKHEKFRESYNKVKTAKKEVGIAEGALDSERSNLDAAYMSGDKKKIAIAEARVKAARDNLKTNQTLLENAQKAHDSNKAIYKDDAAIENKYKYYADNYAAKTVDIDDVERIETEKYDNKSRNLPVNNSSQDIDENVPIQELSKEEVDRVISNKHHEIEEQEKIMYDLNNKVAQALASGNHEHVVQARADYVAAETRRDVLYDQLAELESLSNDASQQPSSGNATNADDSDNLVQPNNDNQPKYTIDDLNKAERELRNYEMKQRFGQATDVEVYQKKLAVDRIRQWLDNNQNN